MQSPRKNGELKAAILCSGLSQKQVAKRAHVPPSYLSLAIHGKYNFEEVQKVRIARILGKLPEELFHDRREF